MPFFSVIIPTYNRDLFLNIAIRSVMEQTFRDYELIVVDDGSTDNTKKIIEKYMLEKSSKLKYIYQKNRGPAASRNTGIKNSNGLYICFLDSDDRFRQNKLEITYDYIKRYPKYKIFHTEEIWYKNSNLLPQKKHHKKPNGWIFKNAVKICSISISTVAIHRDVFSDVGLFDENLLACEDYDFWLRVTSKYPVKLIPHYLTIKEGGHPDQQSFKFEVMDRFRIYALKKILENNSLTKENYNYALETLIEKCNIVINGALKRKKYNEAKEYSLLINQFKNV